MKIYKISSESIASWITRDGNYYESRLGHDVLVHQNPSLFGLPSYISKQKYDVSNDYKGLAINKGNVAIRIMPERSGNGSYMAIFGKRESIRSLLEKIQDLTLENNVTSFVVNINGTYDSLYIDRDSFFRKYSKISGFKIYKIAQNIMTQWEMKQKMIPLRKAYDGFLNRKWKGEILSPQEEQAMGNVSNELNRLGDLLENDINNKKQTSKEMISQGREHEVTPSNFMDYHYTGFIGDHAYEKYKTKEGVAWQGKPEKYPRLIQSKIYGNELIEFRSSNDPLQYVKHDSEDEIMRDEGGNAMYLSEEEMKQKGLPTIETTIVAFNSNKEPIGWVSDEFGADGVFIIDEYQGKGIGTDLLHVFRKQFPRKRRIGQMTSKGQGMTRSYHKKLILDALKQGKHVPEEILQEYGIK